jgi:hypothetical protein
MPKMITIRYKDSSPNWPGDVAAMNKFNLPQGFDGPKYPGYEEQIPGDLLDDTDKVIDYKGPADQRGGRDHEQITEMEYRKRLYETGGYHNHSSRKMHQPAPPRLMQNKSMLKVYSPPRALQAQDLENFLWKTKVATLVLKEFNPICMELISEVTDDMMATLKTKAKEPGGKIYENLLKGPGMIKPTKEERDMPKAAPANDAPDITQMDENNAVKYVKEVSDVDLLKNYSAQESKKSRPRVAVAIETRIQELSKPSAL